MKINKITVAQIKTVDKPAVKNDKSVGNIAMSCQTAPTFKSDYTSPMFGILPNFKLSKTLNSSPVTFKGAVIKKSDFEGIDLAVIEKYKPNIQQFKSKDDLQKFAENKIDKLKEKDFGGRQEETKIQRKAMLKEWFDYTIKENDAYSNTQCLVILSAITKDLKANNDAIPPVLNKGILADTVSKLEEKLKRNSKENFDFNKMYQNNLRTNLMKDSNTRETMTGWVIIPSKTNDPENFEKNVEKLKTLSHKNWCTKSFNAEPYLSQGDFHVYLENGQPKLGVRFIGNEVQEIQGEKNDGKIPQKYFENFKNHQKEYNIKLTSNAQNEVQNAEIAKKTIVDIKKNLGSAINLNVIDDAITIFNYVGIKAERKDNGLVISAYKQPDFGYSCELSFEDLEIDENKLFTYIREIKGNANFEYSKITGLGQLQSIGGNADFWSSNITNLGQLQSIGECANFEYSKITDLGQLQSIGEDAYFENSKVTNLGQLQSIGGNAFFKNSKITDLGQLQSIGGDVCLNNQKTLSKKDFKHITIGGEIKE